MSREDKIIEEILSSLKEILDSSSYIIYDKNKQSTYEKDIELLSTAIYHLEQGDIEKVLTSKERRNLYE